MLDFAIPVMFVSQLFDSEKRKVYMYAAAAHTVHLFGTILPLVFAIYFSGNISWFSDFFLEILISEYYGAIPVCYNIMNLPI